MSVIDEVYNKDTYGDEDDTKITVETTNKAEQAQSVVTDDKTMTNGEEKNADSVVTEHKDSNNISADSTASTATLTPIKNDSSKKETDDATIAAAKEKLSKEMEAFRDKMRRSDAFMVYQSAGVITVVEGTAYYLQKLANNPELALLMLDEHKNVADCGQYVNQAAMKKITDCKLYGVGNLPTETFCEFIWEYYQMPPKTAQDYINEQKKKKKESDAKIAAIKAKSTTKKASSSSNNTSASKKASTAATIDEKPITEMQQQSFF